jgi:hypothetical protein
MMKPRALLLASTALVALGALTSAGLDHVAGQRARGVADRLGLIGGTIEADALAGRVVLRDATLPLGAGRVEIGALTLQGRSLGLGLIGPARADAATRGKDIVVVWPFGTYRIPAIEAQGANISDAELAALFDAKAPTPLPERLAKLNAAAIVAPEVIAETKVGDQTQRLVYKDVRLANIVAGKVAQMTTAGANMTATNPDLGEISSVYGPMSVKAVDLPLAARFFSEKARPGEARAQLYAEFTLDGFQMKATKPGFDFRLAKASGTGVKVRPLTQGLSALMDLAAQGAKKKQDAGAAGPDPKAAAAILADLFDAMELGGMEMSGFEGKAADKDGKPVAISLARMGFSGFGGGAPRLGEMVYEGLKVSGDDARVALGGLAIRGLDLSNSLKTAMAVANGDAAAGQNPRAAIPTLDQFVINGVDIDVAAKDGKGNAENGARTKLQLGKFEFKGANYILGIPTKIGLALEKLAFDLGANPSDPQLKELASHGLKRIDASARVSAAWDEPKQELTLDDASFEGDRLGAIKLSLVAGNVGKELFSGNAAMAQAAALGAVLKKLDLAATDTGMLGLVLAMDAKQKGKTVDQARSEYVSAAAIGIPAMLGNHPSAKALGAAVSKFLAQPKNLKISVASKEGVGAADVAIMQSPADLLSKIELKAVANQ